MQRVPSPTKGRVCVVWRAQMMAAKETTLYTGLYRFFSAGVQVFAANVQIVSVGVQVYKFFPAHLLKIYRNTCMSCCFYI